MAEQNPRTPTEQVSSSAHARPRQPEDVETPHHPQRFLWGRGASRMGRQVIIIITGFLFVQHLRGFFRPVLAFGNLLFIQTSTNATDDHKYSLFPSQILTVSQFGII